jgi:hypothetical protein
MKAILLISALTLSLSGFTTTHHLPGNVDFSDLNSEEVREEETIDTDESTDLKDGSQELEEREEVEEANWKESEEEYLDEGEY